MSTGRFIVGGVLILIGLSSLLGVSLFHFIFPLIIIWIGWKTISKDKWSAGHDWKNDSISKSTESEIYEEAVFAAVKKKFESNSFAGGKVTAIFSGVEIDLSKVKTDEKEIEIELVAIFGGIKLRVPENWMVKSDVVSVIGGFDNKTESEKSGKVILKVNGSSIFGGIDVMN